MSLTPELEGDAKSKMRLATTRGCRNFPSLDMGPIQLGFYEVYANVAYFLGSTFLLQDRDMGKEILEQVVQAQQDLLAKRTNDQVLLTFSQEEAKKIRGLTLGLSAEMSRVMIQYARDNPGSSAVQVRRKSLLTTRWNLLANAWTDKAIELALARFKNAERGDSLAEPDPVGRSRPR